MDADPPRQSRTRWLGGSSSATRGRRMQRRRRRGSTPLRMSLQHQCLAPLHTSVTIPIPESTKWRRAIPSEEITIQMPLADSEQPARQNRQVGSSARRLRQVGWSARRFRQEPFDELSARMKCHWRAFFELSELIAESLRQVAKTRKSPTPSEPRKTVVNLVLQWVGSGSPEYAMLNVKWSQTQVYTICHPVACITGDITCRTSRSHNQTQNDRCPSHVKST